MDGSLTGTTPAKAALRRGLLLLATVVFVGMSFPATLDYARLLHYDSFLHLGDLYPRWYGTRELFLHHRSPYSAEVSAEIQTAYYGHPLDPDVRQNRQGFAYPIYVSFLVLPAAGISFAMARLVFTGMLALAGVAFVLCCLKIARWTPSLQARIAVFLLCIGSIPALMALMLQQLTLLVAFLAAASIVSLMKSRPFLSGALLAAATIKPQLVVIPCVWLVFWSLFHGRTGRRFIGAFGISLGALILAGELVLPGWLSEFRHALFAYAGYSALYSPLALKLFGGIGGTLVSALLLCLIAVAAIRYREVEVREPGFSFTCASTFAVTLIAVPGVGGYVYNHVLLFPALLLLGRVWGRLSWLTKTAVALPVLTPFAEVLAGALGYDGPWRREALALFLVLPVLTVAALMLRWRMLTHEPAQRAT